MQRTRAGTAVVVPQAARLVEAGAPGRRVCTAAGAVGGHKLAGRLAVGRGQCACALALRVLLNLDGGALFVTNA